MPFRNFVKKVHKLVIKQLLVITKENIINAAYFCQNIHLENENFNFRVSNKKVYPTKRII